MKKTLKIWGLFFIFGIIAPNCQSGNNPTGKNDAKHLVSNDIDSIMLDGLNPDSDSIDFIYPRCIYNILNSCFGNYNGRNYAPQIYIDRLIKSLQYVTLSDGGVSQRLFTLSTDKLPESFSSDIDLKLVGKGYKNADFQINLPHTQNTVLLNKKLNIMCLGDSQTDADYIDSYIRQFVIKDAIDYQIRTNETERNFDFNMLGTMAHDQLEHFTYRGINVSVNNYNEGRSSWAAVTYLRHAEKYTWASISYNGVSKSILHVAWRALGLYENLGRDYVENKEDRNLIAQTCSGQHNITKSCVDGFVFNHYKLLAGIPAVNFENATDKQKQLIVDAIKTKWENPDNPFYSYKMVQKTKNTDNCYAFDFSVYLDRYKTHEKNGNELTKKGSKAISDSYVCKPDYVSVYLGSNDSRFYGLDQVEELIGNIYFLNQLIVAQTGARVITGQIALPQAIFKSRYAEHSQTKTGGFDRHFYVEELQKQCGEEDKQASESIFFNPSFFVQRFGQALYPSFVDTANDSDIGHIIRINDEHMSREAYSDIAFQIYAQIAYIENLYTK